MATAAKLPFSWRDVEVLPDLERLRLVLAVLPDEEIVTALEVCRGRGRNDYPVRAMWRALIAGVVLQHASMQSLLRELGRNPALLEICGFDPLPYQSGAGDGASRRACGNAPGAGSFDGAEPLELLAVFWGVLCSLRTSRGWCPP